MPQEMVYIPFKLQAWQHGAVRLDAPHEDPGGAAAELSARAAAALPIGRRAIAVSVLNVQREQVNPSIYLYLYMCLYIYIYIDK